MPYCYTQNGHFWPQMDKIRSFWAWNWCFSLPLPFTRLFNLYLSQENTAARASSNIVSIISFIIFCWPYWENVKSIGALKLDLFWLLIDKVIQEKQNAKWKKEQFILKKWRKKFYWPKSLRKYMIKLYTEFERIVQFYFRRI